MKNYRIFLATILSALLLSVSTGAQAQRPSPSIERVTVHVEGLTSATRDALIRTTAPGDPRVVFACVPAGILVLESTTGESRSQLETRTLTALFNRAVAGHRTHIVDQSLAQAEASCAEIRNR